MTFPTPSPADWKALAEKALKDRPIESLIHLDADHLAEHVDCARLLSLA